MSKEEEKWDLVVKPSTGWFDVSLKELWRYRDLISLFVKRDFVAVYKQTILGPLWYVIRPLFTALVYSLVWSRIAGLSTENLPPLVFYMIGIVTWTYFADCLNKTSDTFISNAHIFGKVYFPRLALPVSVVISTLLSFSIQLGVFMGVSLYAYHFSAMGENIQPTIALVAVPLMVLIMAMLGLGLGIIISSLTTKYRDVKHLISFGVQLLMFASPVIYPLSFIKHEGFRAIILMNPMTPVIEGFRYAFLGGGSFSWYYLAYSFVFALVSLTIGILIFSRIEKNFMDTV